MAALQPELSYRHGTWEGYRRNLCRCPECRKWNADRVAEWRRQAIEKGSQRSLVFGNKGGTGWQRWARNRMDTGAWNG